MSGFFIYICSMEKFTIKKGNHYSDACWFKKWIPHRIDKLERTVRFTESCLNTDSNGQINKLFGFTLGICSPEYNSIRIGWVGHKDHIAIHAFWHLRGEFFSKFLINTYIGESVGCGIYLSDPYSVSLIGERLWNNYEIRIAHFTFPIKCEWKERSYGFHLFPYFGGEIAAPHDIQILMS